MALRILVMTTTLSFSVFFPMSGAWALQVSPASLTFTAVQGGLTSTSQTLSFSKNNKRQLSWASTDNASWLSVTPTSGTITQSDRVVVSVNPAGLGVGVYTAAVIITVNKGGSMTVPVILMVTSPTTPTTSTSPTSTTSPTSATSSTSPTSSTSSTSSTSAVATLSWTANTDADLAGYKVYMGNASGVYGAPIVAGNVTSYVLNNLKIGNTYYFTVTAYDTAGNESLHSTEVSKSIY